jgi:hypothetical protein
MNESRPHDAVLERLLHDLEDGNLSVEGWRKLEQRLIADPEARRRYREHMAFASALHAEARAVGEIEGCVPGAPVEPRERRVFARSVLAAAAVLALLAGVATWITVPRPDPARVVAGPAASWHFVAGGIDPGGRLIPGSRVVVAAGMVEMVSRTGTRVVLEAPSDFQWKGPLAGELRDGQAWFAVARGDEGFKVRVGALDVTDLGTEFGLRFRPGGDEVHVGLGRVRVESIFDPKLAVELHAGEAVVAGPTGRTRGIPCRAEEFARQLYDRVPMIRWSFDGSDGARMPAGASGVTAEPISILDEGGAVREPVLVEGRFGRALDLGASGFGARSGFEGFAGGVPRTVAVWVKGGPLPHRIDEATGRDMHPSILRWGRNGSEGGKWQLAVFPEGDGMVTQWGSSWVGSAMPAGVSALDHRWHHLAAVFTGRYGDDGVPEIVHYLDGRRLRQADALALVPVNTITNHAHSRSLSLGLQERPSDLDHPVPAIAVDELVIIRHALDDGQVRTLFETNEWRPRNGAPNPKTTEP